MKMIRRSILSLSLAMALAAGVLGVSARGFAAGRPDEAATRPDTAAVSTLNLEGAVVIGASVSAGFGCLMPVDVTPPDAPKDTPPATAMGTVRLADMLAAASNNPSFKPRSLATLRFFQNPEVISQQTLEQALEAKPKLVFAVDYLFWHAYGWLPDEPSRIDRFERGLKRLEQFDSSVPVVVGDLPDMRHATLMLRPEMVPEVATLAKLNERVREWAKGHPNIVIIPLSGFVKAAMDGSDATVAGRSWPKDETQTWLQGDGLHATPRGLALLTLDALRRLNDAHALPAGTIFPDDPKVLLDRVRPQAPKKARNKDSATKPDAAHAPEPVPAGGK